MHLGNPPPPKKNPEENTLNRSGVPDKQHFKNHIYDKEVPTNVRVHLPVEIWMKTAFTSVNSFAKIGHLVTYLFIYDSFNDAANTSFTYHQTFNE